jgi:hypothetical protein
MKKAIDSRGGEGHSKSRVPVILIVLGSIIRKTVSNVEPVFVKLRATVRMITRAGVI